MTVLPKHPNPFATFIYHLDKMMELLGDDAPQHIKDAADQIRVKIAQMDEILEDVPDLFQKIHQYIEEAN